MCNNPRTQECNDTNKIQQEVDRLSLLSLLNKSNDEILKSLFDKIWQHQMSFCQLFLQTCKNENKVKHE